MKLYVSKRGEDGRCGSLSVAFPSFVLLEVAVGFLMLRLLLSPRELLLGKRQLCLQPRGLTPRHALPTQEKAILKKSAYRNSTSLSSGACDLNCARASRS